MIDPFNTLEEGILILQQKAKNNPISIEEILHILSGKGRALILILLCFPFCQPIQIPGLSTPFGLGIAFIGLRMAFGRHVWLPQKILSTTVSPSTLDKITSKVLLLVRKMKGWIHPRLNWICHSPPMQMINGLTIALLGIFLALPLPIPFSNMTAAWSIFLISLGIMEDDGVFIAMGYLTFLLTLIFLAIMAFSIKHIFF